MSILLISVVLPVALAAVPLTDKQVPCSQYGDGYVPAKTFTHAELLMGAMIGCSEECPARRLQLQCLDIEPTEELRSIVQAICDSGDNGEYICTFKNINGTSVTTPEYTAKYYEVAKDNPDCALKESLYIAYSAAGNGSNKWIIIGSVFLVIFVLFGCAIVFICGAICVAGKIDLGR